MKLVVRSTVGYLASKTLVLKEQGRGVLHVRLFLDLLPAVCTSLAKESSVDATSIPLQVVEGRSKSDGQ